MCPASWAVANPTSNALTECPRARRVIEPTALSSVSITPSRWTSSLTATMAETGPQRLIRRADPHPLPRPRPTAYPAHQAGVLPPG
ncbi:MAG: hypothetical protein ACRDRU_21555 [Pseudonocardiaceae bacterium]